MPGPDAREPRPFDPTMATRIGRGTPPTEAPPIEQPAPTPPEGPPKGPVQPPKPEERRFSRRAFLGGAAAVAVEEIATRGAVIRAVARGIRSLFDSKNQGDPKPTPTGSKPTPSSSGSPSPDGSGEPTPEIKIKPTGDLLWGDKPAPLGILVEPSYNEQDGSTDVIATGIITDVKEKSIVVEEGKGKEKVTIISVNFGKQGGPEYIVGKFILGGDNDILPLHYLRAQSLLFDPHPSTSPLENGETKPVREFVSEIKLGGQYAFRILINQDESAFPSNCDEIPGCRRYRSFTEFLPNNNSLVSSLTSGRAFYNSQLGWLNEIFIPKPLQD